MKSIFHLQINTKVFCKMVASLWVCVARHGQSTQSNKFAISLQDLKKNIKDEVDFLPRDKSQRFFKLIQSFKVCIASHCQSSENSMFAISLQYLKKEVRDKFYFLHIDKHQNYLQVDFNTWCIKVSYKVTLSLLKFMIKHSQNT